MVKIENKSTLFAPERLIISTIFLIGIFLRIYRITAWDVWFDESYMIHTALGNFDFVKTAGPIYTAIISFILQNTHHFHIFFLRLFSLDCDLAAAVFVYKTARYIFSRRAALISVMFFAVSGFHVWYSQEVTGYTFFGMLTMINIYYFFKAFRENRFIYFLIYAIASLCLIVSIPTALFVWLSEIIFVLCACKKRKIRYNFLYIFLFISICYSFIFFSQGGGAIVKFVFSRRFWIPRMDWAYLAISLSEMYIGYCGNIPMYAVTFILTIIILFYFVYKWKNYISPEVIFLIGVTFVQIILLFVYSQHSPIYTTRYFFYISGILYIVSAKILSDIPHRPIFIGIIIAVMAIGNIYYYFFPGSCESIYHVGTHPKTKYCRRLFALFDSKAKPGDVLAITTMRFSGGITSLYSRHIFHFNNFTYRKKICLSGLKHVAPVDVPLMFLYVPVNKNDLNYWYWVSHRIFGNVLKGLYKEYTVLEKYPFKRLWLIVSWWDKGRGCCYKGKSDYLAAMMIYGWCEEHFKRVWKTNFPDGYMILYTR